MPILVTKTYLVDTNDIDEAYELTKPTNDKVGTLVVGQLRIYDPKTQGQVQQPVEGQRSLGLVQMATPPKPPPPSG